MRNWKCTYPNGEPMYCNKKGHLLVDENKKVRSNGQVSCRRCEAESMLQRRYGIDSIEERDAILEAQG